MDWKEYYKSRTVSAKEAAQQIQSNMVVCLAHATCVPESVLEAMADRHEEVKNVMLSHSLNYSGARLVTYPESYHSNSMFSGPKFRGPINEGHGYVTPIHFTKIPQYQRELKPDFTLTICSPPDEHGYVNLGTSIDYGRNLVYAADKVIAEVNPNVPIVYGDAWVKVTDIDYFVEVDTPMIAVKQGEPGELEKIMAGHIAQYIKDGDCLQLGIGGVPDAVLGFMNDKHDLGIHSEMISDGVMQLVKSGNINCSRKSLHPNQITFTFAAGSQEFYDWMDKNPMLLGLDVEYLNDPFIIAKNDNMVSINGAVSVDLLGQVSADSVAGKHWSGAGGQVDFVRGAIRSKGGRSFIALPATAKGGAFSRIVAHLDPGQTITTSYYDVDHIVTEYGVAKLFGKSLSYRRDALIEIAAPQFRDQLREESKQRHPYIKADACKIRQHEDRKHLM